jgi:opacity protein-like surface antigen
MQHGPTGVIGYNSLFLDKKLLLGAEVRMGYSILNSNYFNEYKADFQTNAYRYDGFASNVFNWPSVHFRMGGLLFDRILPYVTAGLGVYTIDYNSKQLTPNASPLEKPYNINGGKTSVNFPVGCGLEFALYQHLHFRLEYLYTVYLPMTENFYKPHGNFSPDHLTYDYTMGSHSILFGVMFNF